MERTSPDENRLYYGFVKKDSELRAAYHLLSHTLEAMLDAVFIIDADCVEIVRTNRAATEIFGYTQEEMSGRPANFLHVDEASLQEFRRHLFPAIEKDGYLRHFQFRMRHKDGTIFPTEHSVMPLVDEQGKRFGWVGIVRDLTEKKKAEAELRIKIELEELISTLSTTFINLEPEHVDEGITRALQEIGQAVDVDRSYLFRFRSDGKHMDNTHEWCGYGIEPQMENLQNMPVDDFYVTRDILKHSKVVQISSLRELPGDATMDREELQREGIKSLVAVPLVCEKAVIGFFGLDAVRQERKWSGDVVSLLTIVGEMFANTLERRRIVRALQKSESLLKGVFDAIRDGMVVLDRDFTVIQHNATMKGWVGRSFVGHKCFSIFWGRNEPCEDCQVAKTLQTGQPKDRVVHWVSPDGNKVWRKVSSFAVHDEKGQVAGAVECVQDITELKRAEEKKTAGMMGES